MSLTGCCLTRRLLLIVLFRRTKKREDSNAAFALVVAVAQTLPARPLVALAPLLLCCDGLGRGAGGGGGGGVRRELCLAEPEQIQVSGFEANKARQRKPLPARDCDELPAPLCCARVGLRWLCCCWPCRKVVEKKQTVGNSELNHTNPPKEPAPPPNGCPPARDSHNDQKHTEPKRTACLPNECCCPAPPKRKLRNMLLNWESSSLW